MVLDHLVVRTPQWRPLLDDLSARFGLEILQGFKSDRGPVSKGVRFGNGPFIDVFDWPSDKEAFDPLLAIEGDIARAQHIAIKCGWDARLYKRGEIPAADRPPWSILSFARGQGLISSIFVIEYEDAPDAWENEQFSGALYDRSAPRGGKTELCQIDILCADVPASTSQLDALLAAPIPLFDLKSNDMGRDRVDAVRIRQDNGRVSRWRCSDFDRY